MTSSSRPEHVRGRLDPCDVVPPGHVVDHAVVGAASAVDQFPDDVRVTRVLGGLGGHPDQQEAQRGAALVLGPVRDPRGRVEVSSRMTSSACPQARRYRDSSAALPLSRRLRSHGPVAAPGTFTAVLDYMDTINGEPIPGRM